MIRIPMSQMTTNRQQLWIRVDCVLGNITTIWNASQNRII